MRTKAEDKVVSRETLVRLRKEASHRGEVVVFTNGCYDILHAGHVLSLEYVKQFGSVLMVGVNSDESVRRIKGAGRPILPERERAVMIAGLESVDWVTIFGEDTPVDLIEVLRPDVHCKGEEYREPRGKPIPEAPIVRAYGGRVEFVPHFMERSSTGIIEGILRGRCGG